jgi:hypothetical protein
MISSRVCFDIRSGGADPDFGSAADAELSCPDEGFGSAEDVGFWAAGGFGLDTDRGSVCEVFCE